MPPRPRVFKSNRCRTTISGIQKHFPNLPKLIPGMSSQAVIARLEAHLAAIRALEQAEAVRKQAKADERVLDAETHELCMAVELFLRGTYGKADVALLADFGLAPRRKPGPKSAEAKKAVAEKGRATRAARAVPGKKKRR